MEAAETISTGRKIEDAERADLETAESREYKLSTFKSLFFPILIMRKHLLSAEGWTTIEPCSNARTSRAFLDSLLKSPDLATYQHGKPSKGSFLRSMNEPLKCSSHSSATNQNAFDDAVSSFGVPFYAETEVMVSICRIRKLFSSVN